MTPPKPPSPKPRTRRRRGRTIMPPAANLRFLGKRILLGVSGSIAAYKAVGLVRDLVQEGAEVTVVMTESATRFVRPLTFEVLSGHSVATDLFAASQEMLHLTLPERADVIVIAPATANVLAKCALGLADDLLSTMVLTSTCPLILAPAMDGGMWDHPAVKANTAALRGRGALVLDPEEGPLASGRTGRGRLPDENVILSAIEAQLCPRRDWGGQRVLVSAGPSGGRVHPGLDRGRHGQDDDLPVVLGNRRDHGRRSRRLSPTAAIARKTQEDRHSLEGAGVGTDRRYPRASHKTAHVADPGGIRGRDSGR